MDMTAVSCCISSFYEFLYDYCICVSSCICMCIISKSWKSDDGNMSVSNHGLML